jgi:TctA family transporter
LKMSHHDVTIFFTRPIAATIMAIVIMVVLWPVLSRIYSSARTAPA